MTMNKHDRAVKAGRASVKSRRAKAAPRIHNVRAGYAYLRGLMVRSGLYADGRRFLCSIDLETYFHPAAEGMSNAEAVAILAGFTGLTKKRILQIVPDLRKEVDAMLAAPLVRRDDQQWSLLDVFEESPADPAD